MDTIEQFLDQVPRAALLPGPTPLHRLSGAEEKLGYEGIYIKRDDMTGIGPGGNKVRSLEYLLGEARAQHCDRILTAGPVQSNLCTLTAAACAKMGLHCDLVHNGDEPKKKQGNLLLNHLLGVPSHFIGEKTSEERSQYTEELAQKYQREGHTPYVVRNGATTGRGALGYVAAVREMKNQCQQMGIPSMTIFAPGGNGGVAAGLIYGNETMGNPFDLVIVSVEDDRETLAAHIQSVIEELTQITGIPISRSPEEVAQITDRFRGEGWGVNTKESAEEIYEFARSEGIFIENVYNSKAAVGMKTWIREGRTKGPVCYLHTGGFGSLFAQYEE